jgi:4-alpha-glucanotransferase
VSERPALARLSSEAGIIDRYLEQTGTRWVETTDQTRAVLLGAMGYDASTESGAAAALESIEAERRSRPLEPVRVVTQTSDDARLLAVSVERDDSNLRWEGELELESGEIHRMEGARSAKGGRRLEIELPLIPPLGYHQLRITVEQGGATQTSDQTVIVVPAECTRPRDLLGRDRGFGIVANLYTLASERNWGIGDMTDLGELARWSASLGASFVGINPLHSLLNRGGDVSPYSPVTRLFRNPIYIDVERAVVRVAPDSADRLLAGAAAGVARLRESASVDYEGVMQLKWPILRRLHSAFLDTATHAQLEEYRGWCAAREPELTDYATYMVIALGEGGAGAAHGNDWRRWPRELRDVAGAGVAELRRRHPMQVDLHRWAQFELDQQMQEVASSSRSAGLRIGLYQDLAIGTSITGSDVWSNPGLFVHGVSVGAPPDPYSDTGQNWGLPPIDPRALRAGRYRYWIKLLQSAFGHAGALRIDHVMGLFRLFWIPAGETGDKGAYVRYPSEDLLGILALESVRNRAIVVGEDLGTVPEDVPKTLRRWGVLSSRVLLFEREGDGEFRGAEAYAERSLATANTHDMPPLEAFWEGLDLPDRAKHGFIPPDSLEAARATRSRDREQLTELLVESKVLRRDVGSGPGASSAADASTASGGSARVESHRGSDADAEETRRELDGLTVRAAVHDFLALTPASLMGISLDDVAGETEPVNIPGTSPDQRPNWTRRMSRTLAEIRASEETARAIGRRVREERC